MPYSIYVSSAYIFSLLNSSHRIWETPVCSLQFAVCSLQFAVCSLQLVWKALYTWCVNYYYIALNKPSLKASQLSYVSVLRQLIHAGIGLVCLWVIPWCLLGSADTIIVMSVVMNMVLHEWKTVALRGRHTWLLHDIDRQLSLPEHALEYPRL